MNAIPFIPVKHRRSRPKRVVDAPPIVSGPNLVTASFDNSGPEFVLTLTFDQPVSLDGFDGSQIVVNDGVTNQESYFGKPDPVLSSPSVVVISLEYLGPYSASEDIILDATGQSGIRSAQTGEVWSGVSGWVI